MKAGSLDRRITIQRKEDSRGRDGSVSHVWNDLATVWAGYDPMKGTERERADRQSARRVARFEIRRDGAVALTRSDRLFFEDEVWDIESIIEIKRRRGWLIDAIVRGAE